MRVTKDNNGTIALAEFGLKLEVNPAQLLKQLMNERSQSLLDEMIELKYGINTGI